MAAADELVLCLRRGEKILVRMNITSVVGVGVRKNVGLKQTLQQACPTEC